MRQRVAILWAMNISRACTTLALSLCAGSVAAADLQILSVGDSLTGMFVYQPRLQTLLEADGHKVTYVGTQGEGAKKHEGHSGKGIHHFVGGLPLPAGQVHGITAALDATWPTAPAGAVPVVLVHHGINDLAHGLGRRGLGDAPVNAEGWCMAAQLVPAAANGSWIDPLGNLDGMPYGAWLKLRLDTMVDLILAHPSQPRLVVAKILPIAKGNEQYQANNDNCCERIKEWNGYWAAKVAAVSGPDAARVTLVDCFSEAESKRGYGAVPAVSWWGEAKQQAGDWVHPSNVSNGGAYSLMATAFKGGIDVVLAAKPAKAATGGKQP